MRFRSRSRAATREAARRLAEAIEAVGETRGTGFVVALSGPLGAGKTEWVKGLADGLGIEEALVASPTFVIASEYPGRRPLAHVDLYRLESEGELEAAGFADLLEPGAVIAVEWADRFPGALPADRVEVRLARDPEGAESVREVEVLGRGPVAALVLARFERASGAEEERAPWR